MKEWPLFWEATCAILQQHPFPLFQVFAVNERSHVWINEPYSFLKTYLPSAATEFWIYLVYRRLYLKGPRPPGKKKTSFRFEAFPFSNV